MWQEGDTWLCTHCGRMCIIQRNVPMDMVTRKRHSCEAYKKHIKANPRPKLSETFAAHSTDTGGKLVQIPYSHCGIWVRKKWRDETRKIMREGQEVTIPFGYMTDEVYQCNKNMSLFLSKYQRPMSEFFIPYDKSVYEYRHPVKRGNWGI